MARRQALFLGSGRDHSQPTSIQNPDRLWDAAAPEVKTSRAYPLRLRRSRRSSPFARSTYQISRTPACWYAGRLSSRSVSRLEGESTSTTKSGAPSNSRGGGVGNRPFLKNHASGAKRRQVARCTVASGP